MFDTDDSESWTLRCTVVHAGAVGDVHEVNVVMVRAAGKRERPAVGDESLPDFHFPTTVEDLQFIPDAITQPRTLA